MFKSLFAMAVVLVMMAGTAYARHHGCGCCGSTAEAAPATAAAPGAPVAQAQAPQSTRSFSYAPSGSVPVGSEYGVQPYFNNSRASYGLRPASAKANFNY